MQQLYKHISLTLKALRKVRGWSLDEAANATGVSKAMLGQIEREESSPTMATLWKISTGFQTSFSLFIEEHHAKKAVRRSGKTQSIHPTDEKIRIMTLFPFDKTLHCEMFLIELLPLCEHLSSPHEKGVIEHVIVAKGSVQILVKGCWETVNEGEGLRFDAHQPHGYRNLHPTQVACIHNVIHYPARRDDACYVGNK